MSFVGASTEEAYLVLVDATIIVYFIPYLYIFLAAVRIFRREAGASFLKVAASLVGEVTTIAAIVLTLFPPEAGGNPFVFLAKTLGGSFLFIAVGVLIFWYAKRKKTGIGNASGGGVLGENGLSS